MKNIENYFNRVPDYKNHYVSTLRNLEKEYINKNIKKYIENKSTLEVGTNNGYYVSLIERLVDYSVHLDISNSSMKYNNAKNKITADYVLHPFKNKSFEQIICFGAVEFIGVEQFLNTSKELLNSNGIIIFCVPYNNFFSYFYEIFYKFKGIKIEKYNKEFKNYNVLYDKKFLMNRYIVIKV